MLIFLVTIKNKKHNTKENKMNEKFPANNNQLDKSEIKTTTPTPPTPMENPSYARFIEQNQIPNEKQISELPESNSIGSSELDNKTPSDSKNIPGPENFADGVSSPFDSGPEDPTQPPKQESLGIDGPTREEPQITDAPPSKYIQPKGSEPTTTLPSGWN